MGIIHNFIETQPIGLREHDGDAPLLKLESLFLWGPVNLAQLVDEVVEYCHLQEPARPVIKRYPADLPEIWGRKGQLQLVLEHLLNNAYQYSPAGTAITVSAEPYKGLTERCNGQVIVSVTNHGSSIPQAEQALIFNKHYLGSRVNPSGQGLGLYLSRRLIELQGGQLEVESSPAEGTTFWFTLPVIYSYC